MAVATSTALLAGTAAAVGGGIADRNANKKALKSQERQRQESQKFIEESVAKARGDLFKLFPAAQEARQSGLQSGMDLFAQTIPAQMQNFQGGNVAAQNTLIQGLPQIQNALLGRPTDLGFQAYQGQGLQGMTPVAPPVAPNINQLGLTAGPQPAVVPQNINTNEIGR